MNINWLEWLGYLASVIILVSLLMSSIKKLRWINLIGSLAFAVYGFMLGSLPVGFMNLGIVIINVYYLMQMYRTKEYFQILHIENNSEYLQHFLDFYAEEIKKFAQNPDVDFKSAPMKFFVLRNMVVAGVFICSEYDNNTLNIDLDFVTPQYRDFRIGLHIFEQEREYFISNGYSKFVSFSSNPDHINYLEKMGFAKSENAADRFEKVI